MEDVPTLVHDIDEAIVLIPLPQFDCSNAKTVSEFCCQLAKRRSGAEKSIGAVVEFHTLNKTKNESIEGIDDRSQSDIIRQFKLYIGMRKRSLSNRYPLVQMSFRCKTVLMNRNT